MTAINYKTYRIKFEKAGPAKYISHLDLNRLFARSLARADIKVAHSEGFNPRPKIVFASTLSLGIESFCEFADIKTAENLTAAQIKNFFPRGINILEVYEPETGFKTIDRTRFHIFVTPAPAGLDGLFAGDAFAEKKPGVNINLKDYICCIKTDKFIDAVLKTNQEMFLNPENIVKAIAAKYEIDGYYIQKIGMYDKNGALFR